MAESDCTRSHAQGMDPVGRHTLYLFRSEVLVTMWKDLNSNMDNGLDVINPWIEAIENEYYRKIGQDIREHVS